MHTQQADQNAMYEDIVTKTAEQASKGCEKAVRIALEGASTLIRKASFVQETARSMGIYTDTIPEYITNMSMLNDKS